MRQNYIISSRVWVCVCDCIFSNTNFIYVGEIYANIVFIHIYSINYISMIHNYDNYNHLINKRLNADFNQFNYVQLKTLKSAAESLLHIL